MTPSRDQVGKGSIRVFIGGDRRGPRLRRKEANIHQSETTQMAIKVKRELCEAQSHLSRKLGLSTVRTRSTMCHEIWNLRMEEVPCMANQMVKPGKEASPS